MIFLALFVFRFNGSRFNQDLPFGHRTSFVTDLPR
jgi:hypothetical protein